MELNDKKNENTTTKIMELPITVPNPRNIQSSITPQVTITQIPSTPSQSKYVQLLNVIEELGRDIRPTYTGSRSSAERIKRGLVHARILVRECLVETEKNGRQ